MSQALKKVREFTIVMGGDYPDKQLVKKVLERKHAWQEWIGRSWRGLEKG